MSYSRDDYWQEAFECAMSDEGLSHLLKQMTPEQRANIGGALCGAHENIGMAFHVPENPYQSENDRLLRKLKWQRELETCSDCNGKGRIIYMAGPWHCDMHCSNCSGTGKAHPAREVEPA